MKKMVSVLLTAILSIALLGCSGMQKKEGVRVKCPACGYEFTTPASGG